MAKAKTQGGKRVGLEAGEHVVYAARLHKIVFLEPAVALVFGSLFLSGLLSWNEKEPQTLGAILIGFGLIWGVKVLRHYLRDGLTITNKRVVGVFGWQKTSQLDIRRQDIAEVLISDGFRKGEIDPVRLLARALFRLDYGTVLIRTIAGQEHRLSVMASPRLLREAMVGFEKSNPGATRRRKGSLFLLLTIMGVAATGAVATDLRGHAAYVPVFLSLGGLAEILFWIAWHGKKEDAGRGAKLE